MNADDTQSRRVADHSIAIAATRSFWSWYRANHIDGFLVLAVMLWLTVRTGEWALDFPYDNKSYTGAEVAMILGAVLTPVGIMQVLFFNIYVKLKSTNGHGSDESVLK